MSKYPNQEQFEAELAEMEARVRAVAIEMPPSAWVKLIAALQLAHRCPFLPEGPVKEELRQTIVGMANIFPPSMKCVRQMIEYGWTTGEEGGQR